MAEYSAASGEARVICEGYYVLSLSGGGGGGARGGGGRPAHAEGCGCGLIDILFVYLPGGTEEGTETLSKDVQMFQLRFEQGLPIQSDSLNRLASCHPVQLLTHMLYITI
jgi:hypothetical protein